jgi:hypothetical protein
MPYTFALFNLALTGVAIALIQSRSPGHLHLLSVMLVSLAVAYPLKAVLLLLDPVGFTTFAHDHDQFTYLVVNLYYFGNVVACIAAVVVFMKAERSAVWNVDVVSHPTSWLVVISVVLIAFYADVYVDYYLDFSLVKNELRRRSLEAQVGAGWVTVLMLCGLPFVYFSVRSCAPFFGKAVAVLLFASVLLVVGSRAYLLGAILLVAVAMFGFSLLRTSAVLSGLAGVGAVIGMLSWGDDSGYVARTALQRFMHTYDGFDLFAAYLEMDRPLHWGSTIVEDVFITYVPRFLWEGKPFLFGSNAVVASLYPDLADTRGLLATFPAGFLLEQYANFWLFGVVSAFLLFGLLSRFPRRDHFRGRFVYLGLFAFAPTFFRSGASFLTLFILLTVLAVVVEMLERSWACVMRQLGVYVSELRTPSDQTHN